MKYEQIDMVVLNEDTPGNVFKNLGSDLIVDSKKKKAIWFHPSHPAPVEQVLAEGLLHVCNRRGSHKPFDFDSNLLSFFLSSKQSLCSQVNKSVAHPIRYGVWIVCDIPPVFDQCLLHSVMIEIAS